MVIIHPIRMDFTQHGVPPRIPGKQDDSCSRAVQISLFCQGAAWVIPPTASLQIRYKTPAGAIGLYDALPDGTPACTATGNQITAVLVDQIYRTPGPVQCELRIVDQQAGISSWSFYVDVEGSPHGDTEAPADYINFLTRLAGQVAANADRAERAAASIDSSAFLGVMDYDPLGAVKAAGGIAQYVQDNAPKVTLSDSVTSTDSSTAASSKAVKAAYDHIRSVSDSVNREDSTTAASSRAVKTAYDKAVAAMAAAGVMGGTVSVVTNAEVTEKVGITEASFAFLEWGPLNIMTGILNIDIDAPETKCSLRLPSSYPAFLNKDANIPVLTSFSFFDSHQVRAVCGLTHIGGQGIGGKWEYWYQLQLVLDQNTKGYRNECSVSAIWLSPDAGG